MRIVPGSELVPAIQNGGINFPNQVEERGPRLWVGSRDENVCSFGYQTCTGVFVATNHNVLLGHYNARKLLLRGREGEAELSELEKMAKFVRGGEAVIWTRDEGKDDFTDRANQEWLAILKTIFTENNIHGTILTIQDPRWEMSAFYFESVLNLTAKEAVMLMFRKMSQTSF